MSLCSNLGFCMEVMNLLQPPRGRMNWFNVFAWCSSECDTMKREIFTQMLWGMVSSLVLVTEREKEDVIYLRHTSWTLWWARLLLGSPSQMSGGSHWGNLVFQAWHWQKSWKIIMFTLSIVLARIHSVFVCNFKQSNAFLSRCNQSVN